MRTSMAIILLVLVALAGLILGAIVLQYYGAPPHGNGVPDGHMGLYFRGTPP